MLHRQVIGVIARSCQSMFAFSQYPGSVVELQLVKMPLQFEDAKFCYRRAAKRTAD